MRSGETLCAAERSRWLAELAEAVRHAQRLARTLHSATLGNGPAIELYRRLESVRIEVEDLRRGSWTAAPTEADPLWTNPFPWERRHAFWRRDR